MFRQAASWPTPPVPVTIQRWSVRRIGLWATIMLLVTLAGVYSTSRYNNNELGTKTPLHIDNLGCARLEPLWLMAQSVPSASLLPYVRSPLAGWRVASVTVNRGRSVITLDNDRAGPGAMVVRLTSGCDPGGATQIVSDQQQVRRYQRTESLTPTFSATRYDLFPGGCVTTRVRAPAARGPEVATDAADPGLHHPPGPPRRAGAALGRAAPLGPRRALTTTPGRRPTRRDADGSSASRRCCRRIDWGRA